MAKQTAMSKLSNSIPKSQLTSSSSSSSSSASATGDTTYTFFKFDVDLTKVEVTIPSKLAQSLLPVVPSSLLRSYLPASFGRTGSYFFSHENRVAIKQFEEQEACSTRDGRYSSKLWSTMIDRKRKPGGYVSLPDAGTLRAAEVYDGGSRYKDCKVKCTSSATSMQIIYTDVPGTERPSTPLSKTEKTANLVDHLQHYFTKENIPLKVATQERDISYSKLCRFSGGGDVTIISCNGPVVIGVPGVDQDAVTPLKNSDVATASNIENKLATNPQSYSDTEQQLFANMHLSSTEALIPQLLDGMIDPNEVDRMIAYGTILKPGANIVALYKLVAPFNEKTYVQVEYRRETIYWHALFDQVLQYTFRKLTL